MSALLISTDLFTDLKENKDKREHALPFLHSNFDLSRTMFALAKAIKKFCGAFSKATEGTGRVALYFGVSLELSLRLYCQRKRINGFVVKLC